LQQVYKKLKKSALAKTALSTSTPPPPTSSTEAAPAPVHPAAGASLVADEHADAELLTLKGKLCRVIDEALGFGVAGEVAEIVGVAGDKLMCRIQRAGTTKLGRNVVCCRSQIVLTAKLPPPLQMKKLTLTADVKLELDLKFDGWELERGASLNKDSRLASIHINMCWWLICRDLSLSGKGVAYLDPEFSAATCYELNLPDVHEVVLATQECELVQQSNASCKPSHSMCSQSSHPEVAEVVLAALAKLQLLIKDAKLILVPVWGGTDGSEHWTLLTLEVRDGKWSAVYKDSLTAKCTSCEDVASKLLTIVSLALEQDVKMPSELGNYAKQRVASGSCGYFVVHWMEEACRRYLGEGEMANGYPEPTRLQLACRKLQLEVGGVRVERSWKASLQVKLLCTAPKLVQVLAFAWKLHARWCNRLESLVAQVKKNKGIRFDKNAKVEKKKAEIAAEAAMKLKVAQKQAADLTFQANAAKLCQKMKMRTWASIGGCSKCRWAQFGSTCCNPDKVAAVSRARAIKQAEMEAKGSTYDDSYDAQVYKEQLEQIYKEIVASKTLQKPPSITKPAGGQVGLCR
jgi:hypothetical protein